MKSILFCLQSLVFLTAKASVDHFPFWQRRLKVFSLGLLPAYMCRMAYFCKLCKFRALRCILGILLRERVLCKRVVKTVYTQSFLIYYTHASLHKKMALLHNSRVFLDPFGKEFLKKINKVTFV